MNNTSIFFTIGGTVLVVAVLAAIFFTSSKPSELAGNTEELGALASCLSDQGVKFYGAFWCPHCQDQKKDFGEAVDLVPYVECSTPNGQGQTPECEAAGITSYPTWVFPNGEQVNGRVGLASLAAATGCPAPGVAS